MKQGCYIISISVTLSVVYNIIGEFLSYIIGTYFITLSGNFTGLLVSCYIIGNLELHYRLMLHYRALLHYRA